MWHHRRGTIGADTARESGIPTHRQHAGDRCGAGAFVWAEKTKTPGHHLFDWRVARRNRETGEGTDATGRDRAIAECMDSPIHWSASEIARKIARKEISAAAVTRAFIQRIDEVNPALNAVVVPRFDEALKEAEQADQRQARGEALGPLHGVPITLKECFHLAGTPSTIGLDSAAFLQPAEHDGISVARMRRA